MLLVPPSRDAPPALVMFPNANLDDAGVAVPVPAPGVTPTNVFPPKPRFAPIGVAFAAPGVIIFDDFRIPNGVALAFSSCCCCNPAPGVDGGIPTAR